MGTLTYDTAVSRAREIADRVLAPVAAQNDESGRFSTEAVVALGREDLLGLMVPVEAGGSAWGHEPLRPSSQHLPEPTRRWRWCT